MARSRPILIAAMALGIAPPAPGDGGTVRASERVGPYLVSAFTSPTPLRTGPVDVSVLVQDAASREPVPDAVVWVRAVARDRPNRSLAKRATADQATNKLFRAALLELPEPGVWDVEVRVTGPGEPAAVRFAAEVGEPLPAVSEFAAWVALPCVAAAAFAAHRLLVRRKARHSPAVAAGRPDSRRNRR